MGLALRVVVTLLGVVLLLAGCSDEGSSGQLLSPPARNLPLEQQAIMNLLELYRSALLQEDIDRLQELLVLDDTGVAAQDSASMTARRFGDLIATAFRTHSMTDLQIPAAEIAFTADLREVTFTEVESAVDIANLTQQTRIFRTTWRMRRNEAPGVVTWRVAEVLRRGPLVEMSTQGQLVAGIPARLTMRALSDTFGLLSAVVTVPETGAVIPLSLNNDVLQGIFTPPEGSQPAPLRVRLQRTSGEVVEFAYPYLLRTAGDGVVARVQGTDDNSFFAVALTPDGTVWGGSERSRDRETALYRVLPGAAVATALPVVLENPQTRVDELLVDDLGRVHALVRAPLSTEFAAVGQDILFDQDVFCATVNAFAEDYPLTVQSPDNTAAHPSPVTRATRAGNGAVWLFGSDGGVVQVSDRFRNGVCPANDLVHYVEVLRRQDNALPVNTVPALVAAADETLWLGTAMGLARRRNAQLTRFPFQRNLALTGNAATLEAFFQEIAAAIFAARPLRTVAIGEVSFLEAFGAPLVKEDLIFSMLQDAQEQLWIGTLGGGLRRLETVSEPPQQTFHLTRQDGLGSNIILALALGPDGSIWAATEEGVSHVQLAGETLTISTFAALDGLALPVSDLTVATDGIVWLATDGGLFRILPQGGMVQGVVQDVAAQPVIGADVVINGTPFRTVTDATGHFTLAMLPPGNSTLRIAGQLATGEAFFPVERQVEVTLGAPASVEIQVGTRQLQSVAGEEQSGTVGTPLPQPLAVRVVDAEGQPVRDVSLTFAVTLGNGTVQPQQTRTDAQGQATAEFTLGTLAGENRVLVTASSEGTLENGTLTFTASGLPDRNTARLILVTGNNQSGPPGAMLPTPLVVQLLDQFRNPLPGEDVAASVQRGTGTVIAAPQTDAAGRASLTLQVGESSTDIVVEVITPELPRVEPVQFLTIVGEVDTPDIPLDLAVDEARQFLFVADRRSDLQVINISDPTAPALTRTEDLDGTTVRLARLGDRLYAGTNFPLRLYILDRSQRILGRFQFPEALQRHSIVGLTVRGTADGRDLAYLVTDARTANTGTLRVLDVTNPSGCTLFGGEGETIQGRPRAIAVAGGFAYVPAGEAGLMVYDLSTPTQPVLASVLEGTFFSTVTLANGFAYVVETRQGNNSFTVLDLSIPASPRRRGLVPVRMTTQVAEVATAITVDERFAYVAQFAAGLQVLDISDPDTPRVVGRVATPSQALNVIQAGGFLYVSDQIFGIQVIARPGDDAVDTDGDDVLDLFDAFPTDPAEFLDTDRDGVGDNTDLDTDNDGFSNAEENAAEPPTDPLNPQDFPLLPPLSTATTIYVDHTCPAGPRDRHGTETAPYCSLTEALRVLRGGIALQVNTVVVQPGTYSPVTTRETFPIDLSGFTSLTLRSADPEDVDVVTATVIDAGFTGDIFFVDTAPEASSRQVTLVGFTLTHGANGVFVRGSLGLTLQNNRLVEHVFAGVNMAGNANRNNLFQGNTIINNAQEGVVLLQTADLIIDQNLIRDNGGIGISLSFDSHATILASQIEGNGDHGIRVSDASSGILTASILHRNGSFGASAGACIPIGNGLLVTASAHIDVSDSHIEANRLAGLVVAQGSTLTAIGNTIASNNRPGLTVNQAPAFTSITIADNLVTDNGQENSPLGHDGIAIINTAANVAITGNTLLRNCNDGIEVNNTAVATVSQNTIVGTCDRFSGVRDNRHGIALLGDTAATVTDNTVTDNGQDGIFVQTAHANLSGNTLRRNQRSGLHFVETSMATATDNIVEDNGRDANRPGSAGILVENSADVVFDRNRIQSNEGEGGLVISRSSASASENTICANGLNGVLVQDQSTATLRANLVCDNFDDGIQIGGERLFVGERSSAQITSGSIIQNQRHGVRIVRNSQGRIGFEGETLSIVANAGAGIFICSDAFAEIDFSRIFFDANAEGDLVEAVPMPDCLP